MSLQVKLIKSPDDLATSQPADTVQTFDGQGCTLGRSSSNTWPLPDPDRFLSSCHCEIVYEENRYFIVDLSTNGTFVNGSPEPLGKGMRAPLADGDTFDIGDYRFSIAMGLKESGNSAFQVKSEPFAQSPFGDFSPPESTDPFSSPFSSSPIIDGLLSLSPDEANNDPLAALDKAQGGYSGSGAELDPFGSNRNTPNHDPYRDMAAVDQTPGMDQALAWPDAAQQDLIPDDWEDDLLGTSAPIAPTPLPKVAPVIPAEPQSEVATPVLTEPLVAEPVSEIEKFELAPEPKPLPKAPDSPAVPTALAPNTDELAQHERAKPPITPMSSPAEVERPLRSSAGRDESFAASLGIDPSQLSDDDLTAINQMGGQLLREIIEGMMQLLRSRTSIKNEFRMNVTTIEPFENNPLKFSVGVDDALENIFLKKGKAYKEPMLAFREGFQEVGEHQLAMIAGIRIGFEKMMERFNPDSLEELFSRRGKKSSIPGVKQARSWTNYCEYYAGFSDNMESSFQSLFGSDFVQAYEDHLRKLSASRKKTNNGRS